MIESIQVTEGYAAELPALQDKTFTFQPGLTLLFGPNGCGKSSLLNIMAGYAACGNGGWSSLRLQHDLLPFDLEEEDFPDCIRVNNCRAVVKWDGSPVFFQSAAKSDAPITYFGQTDILSEHEEIMEVMSKPSDGQKRLDRINRLAKLLPNPPDLTDTKNLHNETMKKFAKYVSSLPRKGPMTLLLDEPDRSLSVENQAIIWAGLSNWAKKFQVIVATHSLMPLLHLPEGSTIIDMADGYLAHSRKVLYLYREGKPFAEIVRVAQIIREAEAKIAKAEAKEKPKSARKEWKDKYKGPRTVTGRDAMSSKPKDRAKKKK